MGICSPNRFNFSLTWVLIEVNGMSDFLIKNENGFIGGPYASYLAKEAFFETLENLKRWKVCRFMWANKTGDYDPSTRRYDGAIGLLTDGLADTYVRPMDYGGLDPEFVDYLNVPFGAMAFSPLQLIQKVANQKVAQSSSLFHFLMPSTGFLTLALVGFLLYWVFSMLSSRFKKSLRLLPSGGKPQTKIVLLFFLLFLFFMCQFFEGSLNTLNVLVRTDDLLYSKEQILKTKKEFCFLEKGSEMDFLKNAPVNSLLYKLYEKRNETDTCYIVVGDRMGNFIQRDTNRIFSISPHVLLDFLTRLVQTLVRRDTYIEASLEIYQSIRSFAIGKGMKIEKRKFFEKWNGFYIEYGFLEGFYRKNPPNFSGIKFEQRGGPDGFMHYDGLQEFIREHTMVTALPFDKLEHLFRIYFALLTAILFLNLAHYYVQTTSIRQILLLRTKTETCRLD